MGRHELGLPVVETIVSDVLMPNQFPLVLVTNLYQVLVRCDECLIKFAPSACKFCNSRHGLLVASF